MNFDDLDSFPDISISEATTDVIKSGESFSLHCRKQAQQALVMAERADAYAEYLRKLAVSYAKLAKQAIDDVSEVIAMEWDIEDEEAEDTEDQEGEQ